MAPLIIIFLAFVLFVAFAPDELKQVVLGLMWAGLALMAVGLPLYALLTR